MSRAKRGVKGRRKANALFERTKGFFGRRNNVYRIARETAIRAGRYQYRDRRLRRREIRGLWIQRINAAAREMGLKYSVVIDLLNKAEIQMDRKVLADLAYQDMAAFRAVIETAQKKVG